MKKLLTLILVIISGLTNAQTLTTKFEQSGGNETPTYFEIIQWWQKADALSNKLTMQAIGSSDAGFPLHLVLVSNKGLRNISQVNRNTQRVIFINNGIHPGEPDGIDATMLLVRDIISGAVKLPDNIVLGIIPVYNIGGCLNRSANYRVDQNGPEAFGSRGNSQNLDLNRDFIKCDSREARTFAQVFHLLNPDVFVDNHVSNGADYQHVMTFLSTQHKKLGGVMGEYLHSVFEPAMYASMQQKGLPMIPYVNVWGNTPDKGWAQFWDSPRYGSGYAALFNCFSFVPESHMLKEYSRRVKATYELMRSFIEVVSANSAQIKSVRELAIANTINATSFPITWKLDSSTYTSYHFKGYEAEQVTSGVSGLPVLHYNRQKPYDRDIPIYDNYQPVTQVQTPKAYIIPKGWWQVIALLQVNQVHMRMLSKDTTLEVLSYKIKEYNSSAQQYEKHHLNSNVTVTSAMQRITFSKGDWYIPVNQAANRFLVEVLTPQTQDSYFAWNFFDAILGQKEGYSGYAFEPIAADYLKTNPALQNLLAEKRAADSSFAHNAAAQLEFVYKHSPWNEPGFMQYPVYSVVKQ